MTDTPAGPNGGGEPDAAAAQQAPRLSILTQYVKDLSFENPRAPYGLQPGQARPEIQIQVDVRAAQIGEGQYEVVLDLNVDAKAGENQVFLVELAYGGVFTLANIPSRQPAAAAADRMPAAAVPVRAPGRGRRDPRRRLPAADDRPDRLRGAVPAPGASRAPKTAQA